MKLFTWRFLAPSRSTPRCARRRVARSRLNFRLGAASRRMELHSARGVAQSTTTTVSVAREFFEPNRPRVTRPQVLYNELLNASTVHARSGKQSLRLRSILGVT